MNNIEIFMSGILLSQLICFVVFCVTNQNEDITLSTACGVWLLCFILIIRTYEIVHNYIRQKTDVVERELKRYEWYNKILKENKSLERQTSEIFKEKLKGNFDLSKENQKMMMDGINEWLQEEV